MFMCNKNYKKRFDENLKKRLFNTYTFYNHDVNTFILLLRKGVSTHMDNWAKFSETSLPEKEDVYSNLNMEDITDENYAHSKKESVKI